MINKSNWWILIGALLSSFLASFCCVGPLIIAALGAGSIGISDITFFAPYRPYILIFVGVTLSYSFYKLYLKSPSCGEGKTCVLPKILFIQRLIFWVMGLISIVFWLLPSMI